MRINSFFLAGNFLDDIVRVLMPFGSPPAVLVDFALCRLWVDRDAMLFFEGVT